MSEKYEVVKGFLSREEALSLGGYFALEVSKISATDSLKHLALKNRPDTWDPWGYMERGREFSDTYFRSRASRGMLIPTGYVIREVETNGKIEPFVDVDTSHDAKVHEVYRKIASIALNDDYEGGLSLFPESGESIKLEAGDLLLYEVSELNLTGVSRLTRGSRLELIYHYSELKLNVRFDEFSMKKIENLSDRF